MVAETPGPSRRRVLGVLGGGLLLGAGAGVAGASLLSDDEATSSPAPRPLEIGGGAHQNGIDVPATPQAHGLLLVVDLDLLDTDGADAVRRSQLTSFLATLQGTITTAFDDPDVTPDGPGDLTVTVGVGPRVVALISDDLPGAEKLPEFAGDTAINSSDRGGDLLLAIHATDPGVVGRVANSFASSLPHVTPRWQQRGFRGPGTGTVVRNPLGFLDGVIVPHGRAELDENVWIGDGPAAGGTICVIRRLQLDEVRFAALSRSAQENVIGRRHSDGAPLSGGQPGDQVDLTAKTPDGEYKVPARSHARAAHPTFTGSALMLRRGYAYDNGPQDAGLLFICFQRDLHTFVATQRRLDEQDDLMDYATPTASASFLILPGFSADKPLGSALIAAATP